LPNYGKAIAQWHPCRGYDYSKVNHLEAVGIPADDSPPKGSQRGIYEQDADFFHSFCASTNAWANKQGNPFPSTLQSNEALPDS